jgi:hypothetical protein
MLSESAGNGGISPGCRVGETERCRSGATRDEAKFLFGQLDDSLHVFTPKLVGDAEQI